mmetsp:Transcript_2508/g.4722  ORF Transcript_2508/g.4722 Transcript_2508/m.4722 type:complete len:95 (-) Transcript_2508:131-415(-)
MVTAVDMLPKVMSLVMDFVANPMEVLSSFMESVVGTMPNFVGDRRGRHFFLECVIVSSYFIFYVYTLRINWFDCEGSDKRRIHDNTPIGIFQVH